MDKETGDNVVNLGGGQNIFKFLEKSYDETVTLLTMSRDYFEQRGRIDKMHLNGEESIIYTLAMSTITTQLTSAMGWLMMCRALQNGEIKIDDLKSDDFRMPDFQLTYEEGDSCFDGLNQPVKEMLKRSSAIYNRIKRMETSIYEKLSEES